MSPYRTATASPAASGWLARRVDMVYGEQVVTITRHRWYWTMLLRAHLWLFFHEWGSVQFKRAS